MIEQPKNMVPVTEKWKLMKIWRKNGYESVLCHVGSTIDKQTGDHVPVAFLRDSFLQEGWMEVRKVFESGPRSDNSLFLDLQTLGFITPEHWDELLCTGKTTGLWEEHKYKGLFLLEK